MVMKKQLKRVMLAGVLMVAMMLPQESKAAETVEQVSSPISICSNYANGFETQLSITNGTANIKASVIGIAGTTTKIHAKVILQKYSNGSWREVKAYEETVSAVSYYLSKSKSVSKGKYRVKGVFTVYKGAKSEKTTKYSGTVSYA